MPAPKRLVAKPRLDGGYQALTNGMPIANVVPGDAEEEAEDDEKRVRAEGSGERYEKHGDSGGCGQDREHDAAAVAICECAGEDGARPNRRVPESR